MSPGEACARCLSACYERNPLVARMLGLCPVLAVTDSLFDGVVFGGFFAAALCITALLGAVTGDLVIRPLRGLFMQLLAATTVAGLGALALIGFYATMASYGVYLALVAANCLLLDYVHEHAQTASIRELARDLPLTAGAVWAGVIAFGTVRGLLAGGEGGTPGLLPVAASPAGALILLGLVAAAANALRARSSSSPPLSAAAMPPEGA